MSNASLYAPWRMEYIRSLDKPEGGCFLCDAADAPEGDYRKLLILWRTAHVTVMLNRYPYTNGHVLVSPRAHKADLEELTEAELLDLQVQTTAVARLLRRAVGAQGFNIGVNVGRAAGAGVPGHLHQHVVPRWAGDTNFISVVGDVRVVPQAMGQLYEELVKEKPEVRSQKPE